MENKQIDILDVLLVLAKHKKFIFFTVLIVSVLAIVYSMLTPLYWTSKATILRSNNQSSSADLIANQLLGSNLSFLGKSLNTQSDELINIMKSRSFAENVINEFNLEKYFQIATADSLLMMEKAVLKLLNGVVSVVEDDDSGLITISAITKDKYLSAEIVNYYWKSLEEYINKQRITSSKKQKLFIGERLKELEIRKDLMNSEILEFQKRTNIIDLESQIDATMSLYSTFLLEIQQLEMRKEIALLNYDENSVKIKRINDELTIAIKQKNKIEKSDPENGTKYGLAISDLPEYTIEYLNLKMQSKINEQLFLFLYPQFEQAKINELQEAPVIEVLDKAIPAGQRTKPRRASICVFSFIFALFVSCILSYIFEAINEIKKNEERNEKINQIKVTFFKK
ncbi:MAG: hypothetical protein KAS49_04775 [Candidatus Cloacimonetes bacterium]|nr:hypothetical protein [Candidatus Cloacimonadota bacterium]